MIKCRCVTCRGAFDWTIEGGVYCADCGSSLCPNCNSHDVVPLFPRVVEVPLIAAQAVRASVPGRPN